jgi:predicted DNA-binding transcriptional regulator AlpA
MTRLDTHEALARSMPEPEPIELWDRQTVLKYFGGTKPLHFSTLYRGIAAGVYPRPVHTSGNSSRWLAHECREALQRMIAARDQPSKHAEYRGRPRSRASAAKAEAT